MKRISVIKTVIVGVLSMILVATTGCAAILESARTESNEEIQIIDRGSNGSGGEWVKTNYGNFRIADGWKFSEEHSSEGKLLFVKDGLDYSTPTSNISVEHGTNKYASDNHVAFREAILEQLLVQIGDDGAKLGGTGTYTDGGNFLYIFSIEEEDGTKTVQYYIVGEYEYILIHETDFNDEKINDVDEAASEMAVSFVWKD